MALAWVLLLVLWPAWALDLARTGRSVVLPQTDRQVLQQLRADDPARIAWGAYHAGERNLAVAVPLLVAALQRPLAAEPGERRAVLGSVLDALIRLRAVVPPEALLAALDHRPHPEFHAQALILLQPRSAPGRRTLLGWLDDPELYPAHWATTARRLATAGARGIGLRLARELRPELDVLVHDVGQQATRLLTRTIGCGRGAPPPPGFPPFHAYRILGGPVVGAVVFADGPLPLYHLREPVASFRCNGMAGVMPMTARARASFSLVEKLLESKRLAMPLRSSYDADIAWTTAEDFRGQVEGVLAELRTDHAELLRLLVAAEWLTAEEAAGLAPAVALVVTDQRSAPREPLPDVSTATSGRRREPRAAAGKRRRPARRAAGDRRVDALGHPPDALPGPGRRATRWRKVPTFLARASRSPTRRVLGATWEPRRNREGVAR